jgi:hypothetical protein
VVSFGNSKRKVRDPVHELTDTRTLAHGTVTSAAEEAAETLRGRGGYFRFRLAYRVFGQVWAYAIERIVRLSRGGQRRGRAYNPKVYRAGKALQQARPAPGPWGLKRLT